MSDKLQGVGRASRILLAFETDGQELGGRELAGLLEGPQEHVSPRPKLAASGFLERSPGTQCRQATTEIGSHLVCNERAA